jgi:Serine/Threonine/Tyrosine Kinase found in polyvalent proteins
MSHHYPIVTENTSRLSDVAFREALNASARGLAAVSGGRDYSEDSWIPFSERLKVFGKSSRQRIGAIPREQSGPDLTNPTAQGRYNPAISESQNLGGSDGACREARLLQVRQIDLLIDTVTRAVESFPEVFKAEAQLNPAGATRAAEESALSAYAAKNGALLDPIEFFGRWRDSGANGGQEHQVVVGDAGQPVEKRTNIPYFHDSWSGYFERIRLHNVLFPEAFITIKGFQNQGRQLGTPYGDVLPSGIYCVIEQTFVNWEREATPEEIRTYLHSGGFVKVPVFAGEKDTGKWYNPKTGVHLVDVRGDNIVLARGDDDLLRPVALDVPIRISHPERDAESRRRVERRSLTNRLANSGALCE